MFHITPIIAIFAKKKLYNEIMPYHDMKTWNRFEVSILKFDGENGASRIM
jgi:hypothetical protein